LKVLDSWMCGSCAAVLMATCCCGQLVGAADAPAKSAAVSAAKPAIDKAAAKAATDEKAGVSKLANHQAKGKVLSRRAVLVPPPPPKIPLSPLTPPSGHSLLGGVTLDYLCRADLLQLQTRVQESLDKCQKDLQERSQELADKKARSEQFAALFKEGVVSRREMESTAKDATDAGDKIKEAQDSVKDLQEDLKRIQAQLVVLKNQEGQGSLTKTKAGRAGVKKPRAKPEGSKTVAGSNEPAGKPAK
jgi:DNA repair exonuclease SbcCD ATPase subunit